MYTLAIAGSGERRQPPGHMPRRHPRTWGQAPSRAHFRALWRTLARFSWRARGLREVAATRGGAARVWELARDSGRATHGGSPKVHVGRALGQGDLGGRAGRAVNSV